MDGMPWSICKSVNSNEAIIIEVQIQYFLLFISHRLFNIKAMESTANNSFNQLNGPAMMKPYKLFEKISLSRLIIAERSISVGIHLK